MPANGLRGAWTLSLQKRFENFLLKLPLQKYNDVLGKDIVVILGKREVILQIKKISNRQDFKRGKKGEYKEITYEMPPAHKILRNGEQSKPFKEWNKKFGNVLKLLPNGFIIFKSAMFKNISA